ncbi:MAG: hypothetical protein H0U45_17140 [Tatlockia sp.]|nr:hypothetical protein [Tatlockia sp.]
MQFTHNKAIIGMPETPYLLRVNKQVDCFSIGNIEPGNIESLNTYGRGKFLEFAIAACDTDLHGRIGKVKESQQYAFISAIVTASDDSRLLKGLLCHFLVYGYEARFFTMLAAEIETAAIFGGSFPQVIRMAFDRSVATVHGTNIKPPTISSRNAVKDELTLFEAAQLIGEKYPAYLPDATALYPMSVDPKSGELLSGLIRHGLAPLLPINEPQPLLA